LYAEELDRLFGEFLPVPQENLRVLDGGETLRIAGRKLEVLYTPGHASHHVTYFDPAEGTAFVGDTAGICMEGDSFVLPATPPPDINLELWDAALDAIAERKPARLFLTHFGYSRHPATHIERYRERLRHWGTPARTSRVPRVRLWSTLPPKFRGHFPPKTPRTSFSMAGCNFPG
jgi:glyoxylase-like metal-dependent hydrolase (beta-lactamase superfamily II)